MNSFSRLVTALILTSSYWRVPWPALPKQTTRQRRSNRSRSTQSTDIAKADASKKVPTTTPGSNKPLSVNEDPAMIGKRNINKGIIAKMSGSTEK